MAPLLLPVTLLLFARSILAAPATVTGTALPQDIARTAGGGLANAYDTPKLSQDGIHYFQLANFLENLESNFFQQGVEKYSSWGGGSVNGVMNKDVITRIAAQEEVHVASIVGLLKGNSAQDVAPCEYSFPITDETSFLALASIITNVGIGALIHLQDKLSKSDPGLEKVVGSILPVESRHDAYFRLTANEVPNPTTFETRITGVWAYNLALDFVKHGSCTNLPPYITGLPIYPDLAIVGSGEPSFNLPGSPGKFIFKVGQPKLLPKGWETKNLWIGWVTQNEAPVYTPVTRGDNGELHADVYPGMYGMAFAVLTGQKSAANIMDLTAATLAGPLPIPLGPGS